MQTFTSVVRCAVCKKVLAKAHGIPAVQEDLTNAAEAATRVLVCSERGHMRNSVLDFEWVAEPPGSPVARVAPPAAVEPTPNVSRETVPGVTSGAVTPGAVTPAAPAVAAPAAVPATPAKPAGPPSPPPIVIGRGSPVDPSAGPGFSDDELTAEIAAYEARQAQAAPEVLVGPMATLPAESPAVPVAEGSVPTYDPNETSELATQLANGAIS